MNDRNKKPRRAKSASILMMELMIGETLEEAQAALEAEGIDVAAMSREIKARAMETARSLGIEPPEEAPSAHALDGAAHWSPMPTAPDAASPGARALQGGRRGWARLEGDAMEGSGVEDGDAALYDPDGAPRDGDLVLAELGGERLALRFRLDGPREPALDTGRPGARKLSAAGPGAPTLMGVVVALSR